MAMTACPLAAKISGYNEIGRTTARARTCLCCRLQSVRDMIARNQAGSCLLGLLGRSNLCVSMSAAPVSGTVYEIVRSGKKSNTITVVNPRRLRQGESSLVAFGPSEGETHMAGHAGFDRSEYPKDGVMDWLKANTNLVWCGYYLGPTPSHSGTSWMGKRKRKSFSSEGGD